MACFKLQPDKTLLLPDFDGYKLSSGSGIVTSYNKILPDGLCQKSVSESSNSYLQTRLDALHNCLVPDLPDSDDSSESDSFTIYCFNKRGHLLAFDWSSESHLNAGRVVWQVDLSLVEPCAPLLLHQPVQEPLQEPNIDSDDGCRTTMFSTLQPTIKFASTNVAVVADGRSKLFVVLTGNRRPEAHHTWLTVFSASIGACEVVDARVSTNHSGTGEELHVLLVSVVPPAALPVAPPSSLSSAPSLHLITWLTLASDNGKEYSVVRERLYCGSAALEYCHFDEDCSAVVLLTHQLYSALHDSCAPLSPPATAQHGLEQPLLHSDKPSPKFMFMQSDDDVTVQLGASNCSSSDCVRIVVSSSELCVSRRESGDGEPLLKGTFIHPVDPETATWTVDGGRVEVNVCKAVAGTKWLRLFVEEELVGEELSPAADNTDRLAHLTSDSWGGGCDVEDKPAYNPGQLESCDEADTDLLLQVIQGDTDGGGAERAPRALLGNTQYLATIPLRNGAPPLFCLRHDVDGLVWRTNSQRGPDTERFSHTATFNAFGYVKASKTMAKYTSAPADCSFVCVSDVRSHVYVFCQPLPLGGELKNRRTGRVTSKVARQLLLSLPSHGEVRGLAALPGLVVLCTAEQVFAYALALQAS